MPVACLAQCPPFPRPLLRDKDGELALCPGAWVKEGLRAASWVSSLELCGGELSLAAEPVLDFGKRPRLWWAGQTGRGLGTRPPLSPSCFVVLGDAERLGVDLRALGEEGGKWEAHGRDIGSDMSQWSF